MQKEVGKCCNCNKTTWAKNKYGYECLECRCSRVATMKQLNVGDYFMLNKNKEK